MFLQNIPSPRAWGGTVHHETATTRVSLSGRVLLSVPKGRAFPRRVSPFRVMSVYRQDTCIHCLVFGLPTEGTRLAKVTSATKTPSPVPPTILLLFLFLNNLTKTLHVIGSITILKKIMIFPQRVTEWPIRKKQWPLTIISVYCSLNSFKTWTPSIAFYTPYLSENPQLLPDGSFPHPTHGEPR